MNLRRPPLSPTIASDRKSNRLGGLGVLLAAGICCLLAGPAAGQSPGGESAKYRLTFQGAWTRTATPGGVPGSAHFSPLIGAIHNDQVTYWSRGGRASPELERVAELGLAARLRALIDRDANAFAALEKTPPRGGRASATIEFEATRDFPLVTLVTMIAPSPDWFVGVGGLSLLDAQGEWRTNHQVDLFPYDAGTEEGTEFSLDNAATVPQGAIASIRGTGKFSDAPMATLSFKLLEDEPDDPDGPDDTDEAEPRFVDDVAAEPSGETAVTVFWRGKWADAARGMLSIEARDQKSGWRSPVTAAAVEGQARIAGLEADAPYTFRLRSETAGGTPEFSPEFSATTGAYDGPCRAGGRYLCLRDGRFEVQAHWTNPGRAGHYGVGGGVPVAISDESGLFWFFDAANIELVVKVLDGRTFNDHYWIFFGALSDVEYWVTVRDVAGGVRRTYHNPPKEVCGQSDVEAFIGGVDTATASSGGDGSTGSGGVDLLRMQVLPFDVTGVPESTDGGGHCEPGPNKLCVLDDRFSIEVRFVDPNVADPEADPEMAGKVASSLTTAATGFFWFFNPENIELASKVLDGRALNGRFWLLYGGVSDVEYTLTVTDTVTGASKSYRNEPGSICGEIDTDAF